MICRSPINMHRPGSRYTKDRINVPCGTCYECRMNYRIGWTFRLMKELKGHKWAWFITLTYNDLHLKPLSKTEMSLFIKRLRKYSGEQLRFYGVGELGEKYNRPHYHFLLFGISSDGLKRGLIKAWSKNGISYGNVLVSPISPARVHYVTKDMTKFNKKSYKYEKENIRVMSLRPPIGRRWLDDYAKHNHDNMNPFIEVNGYRHIMPRLYKEKVFSYSQLEQIQNDLIKFTDECEKQAIYEAKQSGVPNYWKHVQDEQQELLRLEELQLKKRKL